MMGRRTLRVMGIGLAVAAALSLGGCGTAIAKVGQSAPSFSLPAMNSGKSVSLKDLAHGEPVILNAWASWCGPCQQETPDLIKLAKEYQGRVAVIGVDMTSVDNLNNAKKFVQDYDIPYPVLLDTKGKFMQSYQIGGFPTTFVISREGRLEQIRAGALTKADMEALFKQALHQG